MGIVPGGASHWLPLVHVNHVAEFMSTLAKEQHPINGAYYLMDEKRKSPSMMELASDMAKELRVGKPMGSISLNLLSKVIGSPLGQKLGIPKESLDFIVRNDTTYSLTAARSIQHKYGLEHSVNASIMPFTYADLDFRLVHSSSQGTAEGFIRKKRGPLATIERSKQKESTVESPPIVFVHGTLSGAYS